MKAALIRELRFLREYRLPSFIACAVFAVAGMVHWVPTAVTFIIVCISIACIVRCFSDDFHSGWGNYSKALPVAAYKAVAVRYLVHFVELTLMCFVVYGVLTFSHNFHSAVSSEATRNWLLLVNFSLSCIALSFIAPVCYACDSQLSRVICKAFSALVIIICAEANVLRTASVLNGLSAIIYLEKWVVAAIIAIDLLLVLISYYLSVLFCGKNCLSSRKKLKIFVSVFGVLVIVLTLTVTLVLNGKDMLTRSITIYDMAELDDEEEYDNSFSAFMDKPEIITNKEVACQESMKALHPYISGRNFAEMSANEIEEYFSVLGMKKQKIKFDFWEDYDKSDFVMRDPFGKIEIKVSDQYDNGYTVEFNAAVGHTPVKYASYSEIKEIADSWVGLTEKELLERFEKCRLNVCVIEDYYNSSEKCFERTYTTGYYIQEYRTPVGRFEACPYINVWVRNGRVCEVLF